MTAPSSIDPARFLHDQLQSASSSSSMITAWARQCCVRPGGLEPGSTWNPAGHQMADLRLCGRQPIRDDTARAVCRAGLLSEPWAR
jgi:hypothetical protein